MGTKVTSMILGILNNGEDIGAINHTFISLIPKVKKPNVVKEFRPISLYNVVYKLVSKVIVNRLNTTMNSIIHDAQSAFIKDRLITDNLMIAFEAFHSMQYGRINNTNYFALKIDLSKAFDKVE